MNSNKSLKHIFNYLFVTVANKFGIISSTFIYSYFLTVDDFGKYNLYSSFLWIFGLLLTFNLSTSYGRYIYEKKPQIDEFFSTLIISIFITFFLFSLIFFLISPYLDSYLSLPMDLLICLILVNVGMPFDVFYSQRMYKLRNSSELLRYSIIKIICLFTLSFILIQSLDQKYLGLIIAEVVISISFAIYILFRMKVNFKFKIDIKHLKYMAKYSLPLLPYMLCSTLLTQSDRIIIGYYFSDYDIGIYSMTYNLGLMMSLVFTSVLNFWNPNFFENMNNYNYGYIIKDSFFLFNLFAFIILIFNFFSGYIFKLIIPTEYLSSIYLIPLAGLCSLSMLVWQIWGSVIGYVNKTYISSLIFMVGTVLNILLNIIFLPKYGFTFALYSTFISYLLIGFLALWFSNSKIQFYKVNLFKIFVVILIVSIFSLIFSIIDFNFWIILFSKLLITLFLFFLLSKNYKLIKKDLFKL